MATKKTTKKSIPAPSPAEDNVTKGDIDSQFESESPVQNETNVHARIAALEAAVTRLMDLVAQLMSTSGAHQPRPQTQDPFQPQTRSHAMQDVGAELGQTGGIRRSKYL